MSKSILFLFLFSLLINVRIHSKGYQFIGDIKNYTQKQNVIEFQCTNARVEVTILDDDLFRIKMINNETFPEDYSYSVLPIKKSPLVFPIIDEGDKIKILSHELILLVSKSPFRLAFYDIRGNLICKDHDAYGMGWNGTKVCCWKELHDEPFYGLGEKTRGLNKRGNIYTMWNSDIPGYTSVQDPLYQSHPFLMSLYHGKGFGIYFDNSYRSQFNLGAGTDQFFSFGADDGLMDYYFIYGPSLKKVLERYGKLVGSMPLPPKWSLSYQQCRWSYYPESEVMALANKFRDKEIPCDVIYLDIHYMDGYRVFTWHPDRFPQPKKMLDELKNMGFKIVVIIDPGIKVDQNYWVYREGIEGDYFCKYPDGSNYRGEVWPSWCHFPDFSKPEARAWFGNLYKGIIDDGIMGFWNDMNEPATWGGTFPDIVQFDNEGKGADHLKMHNLYGFLMAKATYNGVKKLRPEQRPFVLTRAGFSGVQRYSAIWTGDNVASWEHLKLSINMCLGLGMSGVAFCGMDIGGFMGTPAPDLYTRWIQLGTFTPLFRTHTCINTPDQEPWSFGDQHEAINKKFIQLRYQLLPYIYDACYESSTHNTPIMRPMIYEYQDDPSAINMDDQFMFGEDLLIAPVFQENQTARKVYFPAGEWYDFWTDEKISGPLEKLVDAPLDKMPIFVKAGAVVPMQEAMQYVDQKKIDPLILHIYPKQGVNLDSLYEDDGVSFNYEKGGYCITAFKLTVDQKKISFRTDRQIGNYSIEERACLVKIHNIKLVPLNVDLNGEKLKKFTSTDQLIEKESGWYYESQYKVLSLKYPDAGKQMKVEVNF
jgi:alpha-glucosidase